MKKILLLPLLILINLASFSNDSINFKNIETIIIEGEYIDLTISSYDGEDIILNQVSENDSFKIYKSIEQNELKYTLKNNQTDIFFKTNVKFNLLVPKKSQYNYKIKTTDTTIFTNKIYGNITIENTNGNIELSDIKGNINIKNLDGAITTTNTLGVLNLITTNKDIEIINADKINRIITSNAHIVAEFNEILPTSKIVTTHDNITIIIPKSSNLSFSIFGDLIKVNNEFPELKTDNILLLGTSNGTIDIKKK